MGSNDLLVKEGFNSMESLNLVIVDREDVQTKIPRGQQKLLLKALLPIQPAEAPHAVLTPTDGDTMAAAATKCAGDSGLPRAQDEGVRQREAGGQYTRLMTTYALCKRDRRRQHAAMPTDRASVTYEETKPTGETDGFRRHQLQDLLELCQVHG